MGCAASTPASETSFNASAAKWEANVLLTSSYFTYTWVHVKSDEATWCGEWRAGEDKTAGEKVESMLYSVERSVPTSAAEDEPEKDAAVGVMDAVDLVAPPVLSDMLGAAEIASDLFASDSSDAFKANYRLLDKGGQVVWQWCAARLASHTALARRATRCPARSAKM